MFTVVYVWKLGAPEYFEAESLDQAVRVAAVFRECGFWAQVRVSL